MCVDVERGWGCECEPGRGGADCTASTHPASFSSSSYVKVALSLAPAPNTTSIQLRYRTWEEWGQLIAVTSQHGRDLAALHLVDGHVCLKMLLHPTALVHLCLSQVLLTDGEWHTVYVRRRLRDICVYSNGNENESESGQGKREGKRRRHVWAFESKGEEKEQNLKQLNLTRGCRKSEIANMNIEERW
nr:putative neural-cadherin 2 [Cherax quadricarinatus]